MTDPRLGALKKSAAEVKAQQERLRYCLPHLFGQKWYAWAKSYFDSTNHVNLLCAANQISKSSTQWRKAIDWATNRKKWPKLWNTTPRQFWYLYPSKDVATAEWETKIRPEFMPRDEYKTHPVYGWTERYDKKQIFAIDFNSGVTIYFKSYEQDVHNLQSGTVHAMFADEELPEELYDELTFRLAAVDGYFHMVFTATRGQLLWLQALEGQGDDEKFPDAFKIQVSMWDCQTYLDGTPGRYTAEKIRRIIAGCKSPAEVLRRVYGKFVRESGRVVGEFDPLKAYMTPVPIPAGWMIFSGIDNGSGGATGHPAAYVYLAVRPDYREGWLVHGWRGDKIETTAGDVVEWWAKDMQMMPRAPVASAYDWAAKDLDTMATRAGLTLTKAEKSHDIGWDFLNTLFKMGMLKVFDTPELRKLGGECLTVMKETPKRKRKDDLMDATRYCVCLVPWDWSIIEVGVRDDERKKEERVWTDAEQARWEEEQRRGQFRKQRQRGEPDTVDDGWGAISDDIEYWNEQYG